MKKRLISIMCAMTLTCSASAISVSDFTDVHPSDWYYNAVSYAVSKGLFSGTSNVTFSPNVSMTRGMFVTALGRFADVDVGSYINTNFSDVSASAYYAPYIAWANSKGLVSGTGDGLFSPNAAVTREQIAKILYTYAKSVGINTDKIYPSDHYYDFSDYLVVSRYAAKAMSWCVNEGIIGGAGSKLHPQNTATRAEVATMLMNAENVWNGDTGHTEPSENTKPPVDNGIEDNTGNDAAHKKPVTDEIEQRPTGKSEVDEYGGYWDYDLSNATFDVINDLREQNGLERLSYSLQVQKWADIRSKELVGAYRDSLYSAHTRPDGSVFATVGKGCNTENALLGLITTDAQENLNKWYASQGHKENMLNTRSKTSAVSTYVLCEKVYAIHLFDILSVEELNQL